MDALTHFTHDECETLREYIKVKDEMDGLKIRSESLNLKVKEIMALHKTDFAEIDGSKFSINMSVRKTIKKGKKDDFIAELLAIGKKHLCLQTIDIDLDSIKSEVDSKQLDKAIYDKYVTETEVKTLKVT